jgi:hypothetical protein
MVLLSLNLECFPRNLNGFQAFNGFPSKFNGFQQLPMAFLKFSIVFLHISKVSLQSSLDFIGISPKFQWFSFILIGFPALL